MFFPNIMPFMR